MLAAYPKHHDRYYSDCCPHCLQAAAVFPCAACGWQLGQDNDPPFLPIGTVLDEHYRIARVLGDGGFGVTYLAWEENLQFPVAIKEFFYRDAATRGTDRLSIEVYPEPLQKAFYHGLDSFLDEARLLARFDRHPSIISVKGFFRANGTGYMVMEYIEGTTMSRYLEECPENKTSLDRTLELLTPIMTALQAMHQEGLLHRDVTPANIYITKENQVKLLDFGAARFHTGNNGKSLSVLLKHGYSPAEQYRSQGNQGPWTDIYSVGATIYRAITGVVPSNALDRLEHDDLAPPSLYGIDLSAEQEAAILKALASNIENRFQSMIEFRQALYGTHVFVQADGTSVAKTVDTARDEAISTDNTILVPNALNKQWTQPYPDQAHAQTSIENKLNSHQTAVRVHTTPVARPKTTPVARPKTTPVARPKTTPVARPKTTPVARPKTTPVARPKTTPVARPKTTPVAQTAVVSDAASQVTTADQPEVGTTVVVADNVTYTTLPKMVELIHSKVTFETKTTWNTQLVVASQTSAPVNSQPKSTGTDIIIPVPPAANINLTAPSQVQAAQGEPTPPTTTHNGRIKHATRILLTIIWSIFLVTSSVAATLYLANKTDLLSSLFNGLPIQNNSSTAAPAPQAVTQARPVPVEAAPAASTHSAIGAVISEVPAKTDSAITVPEQSVTLNSSAVSTVSTNNTQEPHTPVAHAESKLQPVTIASQEPAKVAVTEPVAVASPEPAKVAVAEPSPKPVAVASPEPAKVAVAEPSPKPVAVASPKPAKVVAAEPSPKPVAVASPEPAKVVAAEPSPKPVAVASPEPAKVAVAEPSPKPVAVASPEPVNAAAITTTVASNTINIASTTAGRTNVTTITPDANNIITVTISPDNAVTITMNPKTAAAKTSPAVADTKIVPATSATSTSVKTVADLHVTKANTAIVPAVPFQVAAATVPTTTPTSIGLMPIPNQVVAAPAPTLPVKIAAITTAFTGIGITMLPRTTKAAYFLPYHVNRFNKQHVVAGSTTVSNKTTTVTSVKIMPAMAATSPLPTKVVLAPVTPVKSIPVTAPTPAKIVAVAAPALPTPIKVAAATVRPTKLVAVTAPTPAKIVAVASIALVTPIKVATATIAPVTSIPVTAPAKVVTVATPILPATAAVKAPPPVKVVVNTPPVIPKQTVEAKPKPSKVAIAGALLPTAAAAATSTPVTQTVINTPTIDQVAPTQHRSDTNKLATTDIGQAQPEVETTAPENLSNNSNNQEAMSMLLEQSEHPAHPITRELQGIFAYKTGVTIGRLMTKPERLEYRYAMQMAQSAEARAQIRELTYARLSERAKMRGMFVVIPDAKARTVPTAPEQQAEPGEEPMHMDPITHELNLTFAYKKPVRLERLMTKQERIEYRYAMYTAMSAAARQQIRELTYARLNQRAIELGMLVVPRNETTHTPSAHAEYAPAMPEIYREEPVPQLRNIHREEPAPHMREISRHEPMRFEMNHKPHRLLSAQHPVAITAHPARLPPRH